MLQSMGSQRVGHGSVTQQQQYNNFNLSCIGVPGGAYCWGISSGQLGMDRLTEDKAVFTQQAPLLEPTTWADTNNATKTGCSHSETQDPIQYRGTNGGAFISRIRPTSGGKK